ncbi:MAG: diacylglycerol kinase family protein [Peptococcaceae bacterium]|nr:diacylglycerol kinase family protein [Peptococcaceae bacterium]
MSGYGRKGSLRFKFSVAWAGIMRLFKVERRNAYIHSAATVLVIIAGFAARLGPMEWVALLVMVGLVWSLELLNTALEILADTIHPKEHPLIGAAKDSAAGAVLVASIMAVVVAVIIFGNRILGGGG